MRRYDTPYLADWLATSLRWVVLVGLLISLFLRGELGSLPFGLLLVMLGWNILNSTLAILSIRLKKNHRQIMLAVDFLLAATFFWVQGGLASASAWVGLMPILTGAVYFEMRGAFLVSAVFVMWQFLSSFDQFSSGWNPVAWEGILVTTYFGEKLQAYKKLTPPQLKELVDLSWKHPEIKAYCDLVAQAERQPILAEFEACQEWAELFADRGRQIQGPKPPN